MILYVELLIHLERNAVQLFNNNVLIEKLNVGECIFKRIVLIDQLCVTSRTYERWKEIKRIEGEAGRALEITETFRRLSEVSRDSGRDRREGGRPQRRAGSEQVTGSSAPSSAVPRHGHSRSTPVLLSRTLLLDPYHTRSIFRWSLCSLLFFVPHHVARFDTFVSATSIFSLVQLRGCSRWLYVFRACNLSMHAPSNDRESFK